MSQHNDKCQANISTHRRDYTLQSRRTYETVAYEKYVSHTRHTNSDTNGRPKAGPAVLCLRSTGFQICRELLSSF